MTPTTSPQRIFMTGGTGYLGSATIPAFVAAGYEVRALSRTPASDARLRELGATPLRGDLRDAAGLRALAAGHDALLHLAFDHAPGGADVDVSAMRALLAAAKENGRPTRVVYTSGVFVLGETDGSDEDAPTDRPLPLVRHRPALEREVLDAADGHILPAVVRPGIVYGGRAGILEIMYGSAERDGEATVFGEGANRWSLVHRDDLARLFVALVRSDATGVFHAVDGVPMPQREVARLASAHVGRPGALAPTPLDRLRPAFGIFADALAADQVVAAPRSARVLGWRPFRKGYPDGA